MLLDDDAAAANPRVGADHVAEAGIFGVAGGVRAALRGTRRDGTSRARAAGAAGERPASTPERAERAAGRAGGGMPNIGPMELIIILVVVLVIFGPKRLPELGRSLGGGMREFKDYVTGKTRDDDVDRLETDARAHGEVEARKP